MSALVSEVKARRAAKSSSDQEGNIRPPRKGAPGGIILGEEAVKELRKRREREIEEEEKRAADKAAGAAEAEGQGEGKGKGGWWGR